MSEADKPVVEYAVFCGLDVGNGDHHACALNRAGKKLHDRPLPNDESALRTVLTSLSRHGPVLMIADQPASIGALAIAVARALGIDVALSTGVGDAADRRPAPG